MENSTKRDNGLKCINCKRAISSVHNQINSIAISTEQDYQKKITSGVGMYCPNCDHILCLACLPIVKEKGKTNLLTRLFGRSNRKLELNLEDIPANILSNAARNKIEEMQLKGMKISVLKCTTCEAYFGELTKDKNKRWEDLSEKITDNYDDITCAEITEMVSDLHVFISRLEKHNLIRERVDSLKNLMEETLDKVALPKLKEVIKVCIDKRQFDEAKKMCSQGKLWTGLMKNKRNWGKNLEEIEWLIDLTKSTSGQKKTIEAVPRTIYIKANTKTDD